MSAILELTQGKLALVASADWKRVAKHKWRYHNGHPVTTVDSKTVSLGRFVLGVTGAAKVYYKDGDGCNCTHANLTRDYREQKKYKTKK